MKTITVSLDVIDSFVKKGGSFVFKKEAEGEIIKLLKLRDLIEEKIKEVKAGIEEAGKSIDPSFKGVIGENLKATYRVFGERYTYDKYNPPDEGFLKTITFSKVDSAKVDEHLEKTDELPEGITLKERTPTISFTLKDNEKDEIELQSAPKLDAGKSK